MEGAVLEEAAIDDKGAGDWVEAKVQDYAAAQKWRGKNFPYGMLNFGLPQSGALKRRTPNHRLD
jgi:hypothetical protein